MQDIADRGLIQRCINKDRAAWAKFIQRYGRLVWWAIREKLKQAAAQYNEQDLEDIFQEIFFSLWSKDKLKTIRDRDNIKPWLVMVAGNATLDYLRSRRKLTSLPEESSAYASPTNPRQLAQEQETAVIINQTIASLSPRDLLIFKLSYAYAKTHQQISEMLNIPVNTVSTVIKRAKDKIKSKIQDENLKNF